MPNKERIEEENKQENIFYIKSERKQNKIETDGNSLQHGHGHSHGHGHGHSHGKPD